MERLCQLWIIGSQYGTIITEEEYRHALIVLEKGIGAIKLNDSGNHTTYPLHQVHKLTSRKMMK